MTNGKLLGANVVYRILNVIVVLTINIFLSRLAGAAGYGILSLLIANATIFNLLSGMGADAGITYNTASGKILPTKITTFIIGILAAQVVLLVIVELICKFATGNFFLLKTSSFEYAWLGLVFLVSISLVEKYTAFLYGRQLFTLTSKILLLTNTVSLVTFIMLYFFVPGKPVIVYISAYIILNFIQAVILMYACHVSSHLPFKIEQIVHADRKLFFSYSMVAFVTNVIQFLAYRVDYWLLDFYSGEEALGVYSLAVRLSQLFWVIPLLFAGMLLPIVAGDRDEYEQTRMHAIVRGMNVMNLFAGVLVYLLAPFVVPFLFGEEYGDTVALLRILLPGVILFCMATILAAWFAGKNMLKVNFAGSAICLVVILLLDLWLIPSLGAVGAAIASTTGYGVTAIYFITVYCFVQHVPISRLLIPGTNDRKYINGILSSVFTKK